eukprot:CAMPEP_0175127536 /NCGR_PEP_ID=MMETSP0087-20121206/4436_1 /TAXON_ID=136419 /ORGANISM="Unknown Unknown, Strain D1" /LENGTH=462 /DNA_ID=CAMNT_0016409515 /DNA_START=59 /DNA_END=1447 /DNA_ORIENTATION=-
MFLPVLLCVILVKVPRAEANIWSNLGFGGGDVPPEAGDVVQLTDANFEEQVIQPKKPFFVEFYAPWCGHCRRLLPTWTKLAQELKGKIKIGMIDCQDHELVKMKYNIMGYPTLILFHRGRQSEFRGPRSLAALKSFLKAHHAVGGDGVNDIPEIDCYNFRGRAESIRLGLAAAKQKWKDNFYAEKGCMWRQTGGCDPAGQREAERDLQCDKEVPADWSGYCECSDGSRPQQVGCSHSVFKCYDFCTKDASAPTKPFSLSKFSSDQGVILPPGKELPILTIDHDPFVSAAVALRTIGRKFKLYGSDKVEHVKVDMLLDFSEAYLEAYEALVAAPDLEDIAPDIVVSFETHKTEFHKNYAIPYLTALSRDLTKNQLNGNCLIGKRLTIADVHAFNAVSLTLGLWPRSLDSFAIVRDWFAEVGVADGISDYLSSPARMQHPNSPDAQFGNAAHPEDTASNPFKIA